MADDRDLKISYIGSQLATFLFGIYVVVLGLTIRRLLTRYTHKNRRIFIAYLVLSFCVASMSYFNLTIKLAIFYTEEEERRHRTQSFYLIIQNLPTTISFFLNVCLSDGLLLYRCFVIWRGRPLVLLIPYIGYFICVVLGILTLIARFAVPFVSPRVLPTGFMFSTAILNILITAMIGGKIFRFVSAVKPILGQKHVQRYISVTALFVETAVAYSGVTIASCIAWYLDQKLLFAIHPVCALIQVICPALIILRVASGTAFTQQTFQIETKMIFGTPLDLATTTSRTEASVPSTIEEAESMGSLRIEEAKNHEDER